MEKDTSKHNQQIFHLEFFLQTFYRYASFEEYTTDTQQNILSLAAGILRAFSYLCRRFNRLGLTSEVSRLTAPLVSI